MLTRDQYHEIDYLVMGIAFDIHNELGRFHDECAYRNALSKELTKHGFKARTEAPLTISHQSFSKTYYADLLINDEIICELKAIKTLHAKNRNQLLNYLLIQNLHYGKLINFGAERVESEFVTTTLTQSDRHPTDLRLDGWDSSIPKAALLEEIVRSLLHEWGSRLDINLYTEAVTHFLGGEQSVIRRINSTFRNETIGTKTIHLLTEGHAFKISSTKTPSVMEYQLTKFLNTTHLDSIFWINLNGNHAQFKQISSCP